MLNKIIHDTNQRNFGLAFIATPWGLLSMRTTRSAMNQELRSVPREEMSFVTWQQMKLMCFSRAEK